MFRTLWSPVGDLPAAVYWRRRAFTLAALVVIISMAVWGVRALFGGDEEPTAVSAGATATPSVSETPTVPSTTTSPSSSTSSKTTPATISASASIPADRACPPGSLELVAGVGDVKLDAKGVAVTIRVTNKGQKDCEVDLGSGNNEVLIYQGDTEVWNSSHCKSANTIDVQKLTPGKEVTAGRREWSLQKSAGACPTGTDRVAVGEYAAVVRLGEEKSPRRGFKVNDK